MELSVRTEENRRKWLKVPLGEAGNSGFHFACNWKSTLGLLFSACVLVSLQVSAQLILVHCTVY